MITLGGIPVAAKRAARRSMGQEPSGRWSASTWTGCCLASLHHGWWKAYNLVFLYASRSGDAYFVSHFFPEDARPMGEVVEIRPFAASASSTVTSLYSILEDFATSRTGCASHRPRDPRQIVQIEHGDIGQALVELTQTRRDEGLSLLGVLIFGVFLEVAMGARRHDLLGQIAMKLVLEDGDFVLQLLLILSAMSGIGRCGARGRRAPRSVWVRLRTFKV